MKTLFSLLFFFFAASVWPDESDSWPMFRGTPSLQGVSQAQLPKALKLRWSYQTEGSIDSSAAIVSGVVYVGSGDGILRAIDLATGKQRWQYKTGGLFGESSPCVYGGAVYIGDLEGTLHAVDAATGKATWTFKTEGEIKSSPNVYENRIYFGSYDEHLYCLSLSGSLIWKYLTGGPVHSTPAAAKGMVYVSGCDAIFRAIAAEKGKEAYKLSIGEYTGASAALRDGHAYVGTFANEVLGLDLEQQKVQWTYRHATRSFPYYSSAAVTQDYVVLGGRDKMVHCLQRSTGKEIWTFLTGARVESSPLITASRVFVGSNDGNLYELDLVSGEKTWEFVAGAALTASPAVAQGSLVIGSQDGMLYCFGN
jgi:eukaryotic-like serine/threonine-protein kinase